MVKKILFISLVLFGLLFSTMPPECFADASAQLEQADAYVEDKNYEQAEAIYRGIVTDYPGTDEAFQAQKSLALLCIITARYPAARQEVDTLLTNFAYHPALPGEVYKIAEQYRRRKRYEDAKSLYEYIAENHSDSDFAIKARRSVVVADILLGNDAAAQAGIDGLIADFADHPELPGEVYKIEAQYWHMKRYEDVKPLCEYIAENHSDSDFAIKARASVAGADILLGNDAAAQAGVDALIRDFAEDPELAGMLWKLGNISCEGGKYDRAAELYQYVIDNWPKTEHEMRAKTGIAKLNISLGNDAAVEATIDILIADFNDHPALPEAVFIIGEQYYYKACAKRGEGLDTKANENFAKAIAVWGKIIQKLHPSAIYTPHAYYFSARCYESVGEYENAIQYYQVVVDNWPDDTRSPGALYSIVRLYEKLESSGQISTVEAATKIRQACKKFLVDYPNSRYAKQLRKILEHWNFIYAWLLSQNK